MFHKSSLYGTMWYRHGELPWLKGFAFNWLFRSLTMSIVVAVVLGMILYGGVLAVAGEALADGRLDYGLMGLASASVSALLLVLPTVVSRSVIKSLLEDPNYRFGPLIGEGKARYKAVAPSIAVLRAFEGLAGSFDSLSAEDQALINWWLSNTWSDDLWFWRESRQYGRLHNAKARWQALDERAKGFMALPLASAPGVARVLDELVEKQYRVAYQEIQAHIAAAVELVKNMTDYLQRAQDDLIEFGQFAPEGFVPPTVKDAPRGDVLSVGLSILSTYERKGVKLD